MISGVHHTGVYDFGLAGRHVCVNQFYGICQSVKLGAEYQANTFDKKTVPRGVGGFIVKTAGKYIATSLHCPECIEHPPIPPSPPTSPNNTVQETIQEQLPVKTTLATIRDVGEQIATHDVRRLKIQNADLQAKLLIANGELEKTKKELDFYKNQFNAVERKYTQLSQKYVEATVFAVK